MVGIGRVALDVADPHHCAEFYEQVVGLERLDADGDRVALGAGGDELVVLRASDAPARRPDEAGLFHLAIRVPDRQALADALYRSADALEGAADHGVSEALYLRDPAGNGVEIYRDRPRSAWPTEDGRVAMGTDRLDVEALRGRGQDVASVPDATEVGHVHLEVTSLAAARHCYVDALDLRIRQQWGEDAAFLAVDDYHHHVGVNGWNERSKPAEGRGLAWYELRVPDPDARAGACRRAGFDVTDHPDGVDVTDADGLTTRLVAAE